MNYALTINDKPFVQGASAKAVTIPRFGSGVIEVEGISTLGSLLRQLPELQGEIGISKFLPDNTSQDQPRSGVF